MDKLSELLKEARPLYRARKRNKAVAKVFFTLSFPMILFMSLIGIYNIGDEIYVSMNNDSFSAELLFDDYGLDGVK